MTSDGESAQSALITGATSGIGRATALALAARGYRVFAIGRDETRGREVANEMGDGGEFIPAHLQSMASVRRLAGQVRDRSSVLDLLVNNAGVTLRRKELTIDGIERTFAINTVAPYLLTRELIGPLAAARGRVVNIVTELFSRLRLKVADLKDPARYSSFSAYSRSKLALEMVTREQANRLKGEGITVVGVHPGVVFDTRLSLEMPRWIMPLGPLAARVMGRSISTPEDAAQRIVDAATGTVEAGFVYSDGHPMKLPAQTDDPAARLDLWQELERLTERTANK